MDKMALGGVTLYAQWDIQSYQVTFESHGGSGVAAQTITYDSLVTAPTSDPTRGGYTFAGWYGEDGENNGGNWGTPWDFTQDKVAAQAMTLYARWYSPPSAPGNLVVSSYDDDSVTLSWDASNNPGSSGGADATITDYMVYYSTTAPVNTSSASSVSSIAATGVTVSGLINNTPYNFMVLAVNSVGLESAPSNEVTQTTDLSDAEKVDADKGDLDIRSAVGGDLQAVKADFTLPVTGGRGTAISWAVTSGTAIVLSGTNGETAAVTRPSALSSDAQVMLRAAITLGNESDTENFTLTVKKAENLTAQESVDKDKTALTVNSFQFAQGDTYGQVTQDFTLPTTGGEGSAISWTLTSGTAISLSGTRNETAAVTRPNYVDGSAAVELKATITKGSVSDTKTFSLTVYRKDRVDIANLGSAVFSLTVADTSVRVLTGRNHTAAVTGSLTAGTDYVLTITGTGVTSGAVSIDNNGTITITGGIALTDAGNYTVKAVGQGNYRNEKTATFTLTVNKRGLGSFVHSFSVGDKDITALTGGTHRVTVGGSLMAGTDYDLRIEGTGVDSGTVRISNSGYITITSAIALSDAGEYTVMAIGKNNYSGTVSDDFFLTVTEKSLTDSGLTLSIGNTAVTALTAKTFDVTVGGGLTKGTDYDLSITGPGATSGAVSIDNDGTITISSDIVVDNAGDYTVTATGTGNYTDTVSDSFTLTVNRKDISSIQSFNVSASSKAATSRTDETYRGGTMGGSLEFGTDYGLAITTKAGGAANFISVDSVDSSSGAVTFTITNGIALNDAGTYTLRAAGMAGSNYTGSVSDDFELTVTKKSLSDLGAAVFDVSVGDKTVTALTGDSHTAAITNTGTPSLAVNTDYSLTITAPAGVTNHLSIDDNGTITIGSAIEVTHAGTYTLTANGLGEYTGSKSDTFFLSVTEKSLTAAGLTLSAGNTAVTALTEATHTVTVGGGLRAGTDYGLSITGPGAASGAVSIDNNGTITITGAISVSDAGSYTVEAAGKNNYIGTVSDTFTLTVNRKDITTIQSFSVLASDKTATSRTSETYQGGTMGGGLKYGTDYSLAITAKAGGAANFFSVDSVDSSSGAITFTITNGIALNDAGTYTLRANGMGNYTGSVSDDFVLTVNQKSLSDLDDAVFGVSAGDKDVTALTEDSHTTTITNTGSPSLVFNTDYSLTITAPAGVTPNHLSIADDGAITIDSAIEVTHGGTYTLTANGLGEYTGSKSDTFTLGVSPKSLTDAGFALSVDAIAATAGTGGSYPAVSAPGFTGGTDYSLAIAAPAGVTNHLSITNDGTITIDPAIEVTHGGTYTVTATGINNYSDTDSAAFTLTVYLPALEGITYADGDFTLDVDIGFGIWPTGENNNQNLVTYAMKPGESLPEGLTLDSTWGKISGTPTEGVPRTAYTIVVTGREGTNYAGGQNEAIIMISVDNAVDTFFDFNLSAAEVDAQKNGADLGQVINITRNDRNFIEDTEYRWAITKKSDGTAPEFMSVTNNKLWITGADIPGSSAAGTYELTAAGHGRYSGEITKEFELKLPADSPPSGAPGITGIAPRDGALAVSWTAPADRGYYDGGKGVITEYTVYWDTASGLTASTAANSQTVLPANNSFEIASLTNGQTYYFIITAATAVGEGPASSAVSGTPSSGYTPPGAPNIVSAIPGSTQVEVGWTAPTDSGLVNNQPGSPSYRIYYSRTPDFGLGQADGYREAANSARSLVVDKLTNLVKYYFRVTAYTGSGESSASTGVLSATPGAVALDANGGSGEPAEAMLSLLTGKIPDYSYGTLERSGYAFAGWNTAADGFGDTYRSGENYSFTEVTTLYAYWLEATEELEYTLIKNDTEYSVKYGEVDQAGADAVTSVIIPAYWQEKPVTEIGDNAFYRPSIVFNNLDSVTMAEGITRIGASAFREAPLEAVTSLPSSVAEIGDYAFQKSKIALDIFYYQEHSSYKIGANSFEDVKTLTATTLPSDFEISEYAFRNTLLRFNSLPNVVYKGHGGFENAQFSNPDIVTSIKKYSLFSTFKGSNITSIDITMKTLFANFTDTFRDCASLKTVTLRFDDNTPGSPAIPTYSDALLGCPSLEAIYVPSSYVNGYKTADGWSSFASIIKAIPGS